MGTKKKVSQSSWLYNGLLRVSRWHFLLVAAYALQIVIYDAWRVIAPDVVLWRWLAVAILFVVVSVVWYLAHNKNNDIATYKRLAFALILAGTAFASFNVYTQRGMASRAVLLFAIPIAVSAILLNRAAIFMTAAIAAATYVATAVIYFTVNFNEGYKTELYGEVLFYSFCFFLVAGLLSAVVKFGGKTDQA